MALVQFSAALHRSCSVSTIPNRTRILIHIANHDFIRCGAYSELVEKQLRKDETSSQEAYCNSKIYFGAEC